MNAKLLAVILVLGLVLTECSARRIRIVRTYHYGGWGRRPFRVRIIRIRRPRRHRRYRGDEELSVPYEDGSEILRDILNEDLETDLAFGEKVQLELQDHDFQT